VSAGSARGALRGAASFLTPFAPDGTPTPASYDWFPLVGAVLGAVVGAAWWGADRVWPPAVAGALAVAADLAVTGLLHVDGLADAADGLLPHLPRERRLAVMAEPATGAFGVATVTGVLLLRFSALVVVRPDVAVVAALWCASRTAMAVAARSLPYARDDGLATAFAGGTGAGRDGARRVALVGGSTATLLAALGEGAVGVLAVALAAGGAAAVLALARRRLGGFTGDVLGAAGVVAETVGLLVVAARA
jgi:adenosylcobinamide-GDP ribazoletransferase